MATTEQWKPFTSPQRVVTHRPGFLWEAKVSMLPGLVVRVLDSYIAGSGLLHAAILGLVPVAKVSGGDEVARGEFMRFLAEAVWYPTALLPSEGVRWEAVDDRSANATIVDGPLALTLLFRFNDATACFQAPEPRPAWVRFLSPAPLLVVWRIPTLTIRVAAQAEKFASIVLV
jgi:hypothetical protein